MSALGSAASASATARGRAVPRAVPQRSPEFAHLDLPRLRAYRSALNHEESRVSYWRRIIQARLDLVRAGEGSSRGGAGYNLRDVLAEARSGQGRRALVEVVPVDDIPPLPDLAGLWDREPLPDDPEGNERLIRDLDNAERQLSAYRTALHARIGAATGELIARYREEPTLCLSALPQEPPRRAVNW